MEQHADNAGWAFFATVFGVMTAQHWVSQFATSIFTLVAGLVVAHFVKRELQRRWPVTQRRRTAKREKAGDTE